MTPQSAGHNRPAADRIWGPVCVGILVLALAFWFLSRPAGAPPSDGATPVAAAPIDPGALVPHELAVLGDDPDGDGVGTANELRAGTNPLVADVPDVQVSFDDIEFGLRVEVSKLSSEERLSIHSHERLDSWHNVRTAGLQTSRTDSRTATAFDGGGAVRAGQFAVPISYVGRHDHREVTTVARSHTAFAVTKDELVGLRTRIDRQVRNKQEHRVRPDAGFFQGRVTATGSHACRLEDFGVNVLVNNRLRWTLRASRDPNFRPLQLGTASGGSESFHLRLDGINAQEMRDHLIGADEVTVAFEVPSTTIKLSGGTDPDGYNRVLNGVRRRCAQVEVVHAGKRECYHISTAAAGGCDEIRLDELLGRLPGAGATVWRVGAAGDYLAECRGRPGLDELDPNRPADSRWCLFHDGEELSGGCRGRAIRPGAHVRLLHVSSHRYWGADGWAGYVAVHQKLKELQAAEYRFWADLDGHDAAADPPRPFDARAESILRDQGAALRARYRAFLNERRPAAVAELFPHLGPAATEFERWFTDGGAPQFRERQTYQAKLTGASVSWNLNKGLEKPEAAVTVRHAGAERVIRSASFEADEGGRSGRFRFAGDGTFEWAPFDEMTLRVRIDGEDALFVRYTAYGSLADALQKHDLSAFGAAPQLSAFALACDVRFGDQGVATGDLREHLDGGRPRVVPRVPAALDPETLAYRCWCLHHPVGYYRAGILFEDLFRTRKADPARYGRLARAAVANFRAHQFRRCAELVAELPAEGSLSAHQRDGFPPGNGPADVRRLGAVAREATGLPRDAADLLRLRRVTELRSSALRLKYLINDPVWRATLDTAEARKWSQALGAQLERERAGAGGCRSQVIGEHVRETLDLLTADLKTVLDRLDR